MRFKDTYQGDGPISLGHFYRTDIRRLVALGQYSPMIFPDAIGDPQVYYTQRSEAPDSLYFAVRNRKKVFAYGCFDPIVNGAALIHAWKKPKVRMEKFRVIQGFRLVLEYGFSELDLRRVATIITAPAKGAINVAEEAGMLREGTMRELQEFEGKFYDCHIYSILQKEF